MTPKIELSPASFIPHSFRTIIHNHSASDSQIRKSTVTGRKSGDLPGIFGKPRNTARTNRPRNLTTGICSIKILYTGRTAMEKGHVRKTQDSRRRKKKARVDQTSAWRFRTQGSVYRENQAKGTLLVAIHGRRRKMVRRHLSWMPDTFRKEGRNSADRSDASGSISKGLYWHNAYA